MEPVKLPSLPTVFDAAPQPGRVEVDYLAINDVVLEVPINQIAVMKQAQNYEWSTLRTSFSRKVKSGYGSVSIRISLIFTGEQINTIFKPLFAGFRATPFCVCYSQYLDKTLRGIETFVDEKAETEYKLFKPLALAVDTVSISTVPQQPDSLAVEIMFQWFNYFPYMNQWIYKIDTDFTKPGTVFNSELWKAFYSPFMNAGPDLKWPHQPDSPESKTSIIFKEFISNAALDPDAQQTVGDMINVIKHSPQKVQTVLQGMINDPTVQWTDQNIWEVFRQKVGKEALANDEDVNEAVRQRFQASVQDDGATTRAVEQTGLGDVLRRIANKSGAVSQQDWEDGVNQAVKKLNQYQAITQQNQDLQNKLGAETPEEDRSGYRKLDSMSVKYTYSSAKEAALGSVSVYGRKRRINISPSNDTIIEAINVVFHYNLVAIPMANYRYPTLQFTGGCSVNVSMSLNCSNSAAQKVNQFYDAVETMALRYRMIPQGLQNITVQNDLLHFLGFRELITERIATQTIEGMPGRSNVLLEFTHPGITYDDKTLNPEQLNQDLIYSDERIREKIADILDSLTVVKGYDTEDASGAAEDSYQNGPYSYEKEERVGGSEEKNKAVKDFAKQYSEAYNITLNEVFNLFFKENAFQYASNQAAGLQGTRERLTASKNAYDAKYAADAAVRAQAQKASEANPVSKTTIEQAYAYFLEIQRHDPQYGTIPEIEQMQHALRVRRGDDNTETTTRSSYQQMRQHAARVKSGFGQVPSDLQGKIKVSDTQQQLLKKIFQPIILKYQNNLTAVVDKVYAGYLDLPQFEEVYKLVNEMGLHTAVPTYADFRPQIENMVTFVNARFPNSDKNLYSYNPDAYLYIPIFDGGVANIDNGALIDGSVLNKARQLSRDSYTNAKEQVYNYFQTDYFASLQKADIQRPYNSMLGFATELTSVPDKAHWFSFKRAKAEITNDTRTDKTIPYFHSLQGEKSYTNALQSQNLNKEASFDNVAKAQINEPTYNQRMSTIFTCTHSTKFLDLLDGVEVGITGESDVPPPAPSAPPPAQQSFVPGAAQDPNVYNPNAPTQSYAPADNSAAPDQVQDAHGVWHKVVPAYQVPPVPSVPEGTPDRDKRQAVINAAWSYYNMYYHLGGDGKRTGIDCSFLTYMSYQKAGINLGTRSAGYQYRVGRAITVDQLLPGDLIFTHHSDSPSTQVDHVVMYVGKSAKGGGLTIIQAPSTGGRVYSSTFSGLKVVGYCSYMDADLPNRVKNQKVGQPVTSTGPAAPAVRNVPTNVTASAVKPLELAFDAFQKELYMGQATGLCRAYPAFKLYFIAEEENRRRMGFDDFFSYSAVQSIRIVRDRNIAADLCELYLTNVSGILTNRKFTQTSDTGINARSPDDKISQADPHNAMTKDTAKENPIASLLLREGAHFSVYLGYSNDARNLELVFTGIITEIEISGSDDMIRVLGQSYGVELVQDIKGYSNPKVAGSTALLTTAGAGGFTFWGFGQNASTGKILEEMITQDEVVHFGRWKVAAQFSTPDRDLLTNKWHWTPYPNDDNIFPPTATEEMHDFSDDIIIETLTYIIYHTTIWDVFQEMTLRHPNHIAAAVPYKAQETDRMTMFFGLPNQLYFARDPTWDETNKTQALKTAQENATEKALSQTNWWKEGLYQGVRALLINGGSVATGTAATVTLASGALPQTFAALSLGYMYNQTVGAWVQTTPDNYLEWSNPNAMDEVNQLTNARLEQAKNLGYIKPFRSYHLLTSKFHIVSNNIQANARDVANTITVRYNESQLSDTSIIENVSNGQLAVAAADAEKTVKLDAALPPEEMRTQTIAFLNVTNKNLAKRYALGMLLRNTKAIYRGELVILGNPSIKPHDVCYILDEYSDMIGPIEVDRVIHVFSQDQGFITEIKPAMVAHVGEWSLLHTIEAMGIVMEGASKWLFNEGQAAGLSSAEARPVSKTAQITGAVFDLFGGFVSDAVINNTQLGFPLVLSPLSYHGRPFAGGVPTSKLPKSAWKNIFGWWSPLAQDGFEMWWDDKWDEIIKGTSAVFGKNTEGVFWNPFNTLKIE